MNRRQLHKYISWLAVISWMTLIFFLSHQPASVSSELSSGVMDRLLIIIEGMIPNVELDLDGIHHYIRKNAHFFAYLILSLLLVYALRMTFSAVKMRKLLLWAFILSLLYAISDEVHQYFIPGRSAEVRDVLIDSVGATVGIVIFYFVNRIYMKRHKNPSCIIDKKAVK